MFSSFPHCLFHSILCKQPWCSFLATKLNVLKILQLLPHALGINSGGHACLLLQQSFWAPSVWAPLLLPVCPNPTPSSSLLTSRPCSSCGPYLEHSLLTHHPHLVLDVAPSEKPLNRISALILTFYLPLSCQPLSWQLSLSTAPSGLNTSFPNGRPASRRQVLCGSCSLFSKWQQSVIFV